MPPTLLLADDSATIRRVVELTFADENITVVSVGDGHQAIARIEAAPPDIVLADTEMPGPNGYEVAEHVKRSPRLAHIPVVLLTGAFESVDRARVGETRCDGVLTKPLEPHVVVARVKELLSRPPGAPASLGDDRLIDPQRKPAVDPAVLDSYFDRLHAAFASPGTPLEEMTLRRAERPTSPPTSERDGIDWFRAGSLSESAVAPPVDLPLAHAVADEPKEPQMTNPIPPLSDAFAALLAAEQREPLSALPSTWPAGAGAAASSAVVDEATRRVLEQMSDKVVREAVTKVVSQVAERLVKEEIERIKGSIK